MKRARGFTLVEVLIATVLLAAGLALAFATITGATHATRRGEAVARDSEHVRAVEGFLRRRIAGARGVAFRVDAASGTPVRFEGGVDRMRFVSDLPDYIGRGGPSLHDVRVEHDPDGRGVRLVLGLSVARPEGADPRPDGAPDVLARGLRSVAFRYRGLGADGAPGDWVDEWPAPEQLPLLVEIRAVDADGHAWPALVVAPRLASAYATGIVR